MPPPPHTFVDVRFIAYNKNPDNNTRTLLCLMCFDIGTWF